VAQHYLHFGGVSPINGINRALIEQIEAELAARGTGMPVYFGNRNWDPFVEDTVAQMRDDGIRQAAVFTTSAWGGYSGCTQYQEDIVRARQSVGSGAPELVKLRQYFDHPLLIEMFADGIAEAAATLPEPLRDDARLIFTAHSIPVRAASRCGPDLYGRQVAYAAGLVAAAAGYADYDQVWQSRSGPPQVPWLGPDIGEHLSSLAEAGTTAVVVCPIGFVADHIEVVWDLDNELLEQANSLGVTLVRTTTPNADPRFARLAVDLIAEVRDGTVEARTADADPVPGCGYDVDGQPCSASPRCVATFPRPTAESR
jgi:ferrochelatase